MKITTQLINKVLQINIKEEMSFDNLGLSFSTIPRSLSFMESEAYAAEINSNANIKGVFILESLIHLITRSEIKLILSDDPRFDFYTLYNYAAKSEYQSLPNRIHADAIVHPQAWIADHNVVIGVGTIIEANASIYPDVHIGRDCRISAGAVIGKDGFEFKRTSKGVLRVIHDGKVVIADRADIGANTCIDKGFAFRDTIIGSDTKIDNLVHVGHGVQIGSRTFVAACAMLGGSTTIGSNVWICPNVSLNTYIKVNDDAYVSLGAVVTKDVEAGQQVTGNFAIPHDKFLAIFKSSLK
jgi:UDP-3-O-[3-hydroxymyristoyl] glucosamine N-acyltransferase